MERGKVSTREAMFDHTKQTSIEKESTKTKCKDINKYNNLTHITFSILFVNYKREGAEMRHIPKFVDGGQLHSLTSTQLFFFNEVHIQQVSGPPTTSKCNEHNIRFPRY